MGGKYEDECYKNNIGRCELDATGPEKGPLAVCGEHGSEFTVFLKDGIFLLGHVLLYFKKGTFH
jgi:hypothetical protein